MASYYEVYEIENAIDRELPLVMEDEIKEHVENAIKWSTSVVYSYEPLFYNRRRGQGGLADPSTYKANYHPKDQELIIEIKTPWQQLRGGEIPSEDLADVISNNQVYNAPPRPFLKTAEQIVNSRRKQLEQIVADYLNKMV